MASSTSKFSFFRAPQNLGLYTELTIDTFLRMVFWAVIICPILMQIYVWNHAIYAAGLIVYYFLISVELLGPTAFLPNKIVISKKRDRIKTIILVSLGSIILTSVFPYLGTSDEVWRPILVIYLVSPLLFAMILCLSRKAIPEINKGE